MDAEATKVQSELASDERGRRRAIRQDAELFEELVKLPAWKRYVHLVETVAQNHYTIVMAPLKTMDGALSSEHAKGTLNGLSLAATLPHAKIKEAADLKPDAEE